MLGAGDYREGVSHIQFSRKIDVEFEARNFKFRGGGAEPEIEGAHRVVFAKPELFHGTMGDIKKKGNVRVVSIREKLAVARDKIDHPFERKLDGLEVLEYVRMIELEVVDDRDLREVMDEL